MSTRAGERVMHRTLSAIVLSAVLPVLVMTYVIGTHVVPTLPPDESAIYVLALSTLLAMATGGYVLWDVARKVAWMAAIVADHDAAPAVAARDDLLGLAEGVETMVARIEGQAHDIQSLAVRLRTVQDELESARQRLADADREERHRAHMAESRLLDHVVTASQRSHEVEVSGEEGLRLPQRDQLSTSRIQAARSSGVKGFERKCVPMTV